MTGKNIGKYQIISELPPGSFGPVYLGRLPESATELEIRKIPLNRCSSAERALLKARIRRAAWVQHQLRHPGIVRLLDSFADAQSCYLVAEHVAGTNLRDLLQRQGLPTLSQALSLTRQALAALDYAHQLRYLDESDTLQIGLLHRDLKPASLVLDATGRLRITEFGVANLPDNPAYPFTGLQPGTLDYLAPELLRGADPDPRTDIFSLGVIIYEMLTGHHPYRRAVSWGAEDSHPGAGSRRLRPAGMAGGPRLSYDQPPPAIAEIRREVEPRLSRILMLALDRRPVVRYSSAAAFLQALQEYEGGVAEGARGEETAERDQGWRLRQREPVRSREPVVIRLPGSRQHHHSSPAQGESVDRILAKGSRKGTRYGALLIMVVLLASTVWIWLKDGYRLAKEPDEPTLAVAGPGGRPNGLAGTGEKMGPTIDAPASGDLSPTGALPETVQAGSADKAGEMFAQTASPGEPAATTSAPPTPATPPTPDEVETIALLAAARDADQNGRFDQALRLYDEYLGRGEVAAEARDVAIYVVKLRRFINHLETARQAYDRQDYARARAAYADALKLRPYSGFARAGLEDAEMKLSAPDNTPAVRPPVPPDELRQLNLSMAQSWSSTPPPRDLAWSGKWVDRWRWC
jgi:serine/threonine protein kinase